jgi:PhnB protein
VAHQAQTIFPHLVVDNASAALEFYKKGLGASELMRMPAEDGKRLMHAEIEVNGSRIFLVDDFPEFREQCGNAMDKPPKTLGGTTVAIHIEVPNCDDAVNRMATAGATVTMPPWDAFWGARYGRVVDPFGHSWSFAHPLPAKS